MEVRWLKLGLIHKEFLIPVWNTVPPKVYVLRPLTLSFTGPTFSEVRLVWSHQVIGKRKKKKKSSVFLNTPALWCYWKLFTQMVLLTKCSSTYTAVLLPRGANRFLHFCLLWSISTPIASKDEYFRTRVNVIAANLCSTGKWDVPGILMMR